MRISRLIKISAGIAFVGLIWILPNMAQAQETDTSRVRLKTGEDSARTFQLDRPFDRPISGGMMTNMGMYNVPSPTQYYRPPFKGQDYLDKAVEAYRKKLEDGMGDNWYWNFLRAVSPYISLELGAFQTMQMEYVDRQNPLFQSYQSKEKKQ